MAIRSPMLALNLRWRFLIATRSAARCVGRGSRVCSSIAYTLEGTVLRESGVELLGEVDGNACGEVLYGEVCGCDFAVHIHVLARCLASRCGDAALRRGCCPRP